MKKMIQLLCSLLFATSISCPADALVVPGEDPGDLRVEECLEVSPGEDIQIILLQMEQDEFGREQSPAIAGRQVLFVRDSQGRVIKNAQVVTTIVGANGRQIMKRAWPSVGGYLVPTGTLSAGQYRVEVEVAADGQFVTDEFMLRKV